MEATDGLMRGQEVDDTGAPIMVPVGPATLGRIMNVVGDPIDERGPIRTARRGSIHADAPTLEEQGPQGEILVTGIKVVDLLAPYSKGGKIGLFGGAGVGKTVSPPSFSFRFPSPFSLFLIQLFSSTGAHHRVD